ncbi:MAG TPA: glycosyltransferase family 39 protein [Draconibacterium sp.]|nr:glycosyltransferase family 39 protein [Draconibacterium sp.]
MKLFSNLERKHYFLLAGWLLLNIIQSAFTNLHADESYYWMYSQHLAWGYFDHPPMAAFLVYLGDSLMHNELGVRLFFILISTITLALIINELDERKDLFFLGLFIISFPLVHTHIGGFMALPDTPLVFFTLLFFLGYKKFIADPNIKMAIILAFVAAAMIYSKYHAFVALGLIVLSNLKLLKNKYFWITVIVTIVLLTPHILWQIDNHFPTFKYHLSDRTKPVRFWTVQNNITSQLLVAGPLTGLIVFFALSKFKVNRDPFRRAIIFSILGFYIFFFLMSFKNRIEAHYTTAITPLLIIATYPVIASKPVLKKWFSRLALPVVIILMIFRFYLAADFIPNYKQFKISFYNHKAATEQIKKMAAGKKVASFNNFDFPGTYQFYTGDPSIHLASPVYRFCQFDLWDEESAAEGDSLFIIIPDRMENTDLIQLKNGKMVKTIVIPEFQSLKKLDINYSNVEIKNDSLNMQITLTNQSDHSIKFKHSSMPLIGFNQHKKDEISTTPLLQITGKEELAPRENVSFRYSVPLKLVDLKQSIQIFTQTKERNRGKMVAINVDDYL